MTFKEFLDLTKPIIGGKCNKSQFAKTLFDTIVGEKDRGFLEDYSDNTFKSYSNGHLQISGIAQVVYPHIDKMEFILYLESFSEDTIFELCEVFKPYIPNINSKTACDDIADLFVDIITTAAAKNASASSNGNESVKDDSNTDDHSGESPCDCFEESEQEPKTDSDGILAEEDTWDPSEGSSDEGKKITVIRQQTNVIQNGENNFNLTNNGTLTFNF